jgi:hypothetical protein
MAELRIIYGLVDPETLLVRYVGQSATGMWRPRSHTRPSYLRDDSYRSRWILSLVRRGLKYVIAILEDGTPDLNAAERWWIAMGRAFGWPLTNLTDGGDGTPGRAWSAASRAKVRATYAAMSPERKAEWSRTSSTNAQGNQRTRGQKRTPEQRAKFSLAQRIRFAIEPHSTDTIAKMSTNRRGRGRVPPRLRINLLRGSQ